MEKAILKTLIYADLFNFPLSLREIHRWLIGRRANPRQIEETLKRMTRKKTVQLKGEYFFLPKRKKLVGLRKLKNRQSMIFLRRARWVGWLLRMVPWIKLMGVSGGLAMENAGKGDDIDLFIVTSKNRLWLSRILILGILSLTQQRRKRSDSKKEAAGKVCCNILLEEDNLEQKDKDIYVAHEVLQMRVLWERGGIYQRYLEENNWVFKYLPNWIAEGRVSRVKRVPRVSRGRNSFVESLESLARKIQLDVMGEPKGLERIQEGGVYFHPEDYREKVLTEYKKRLKQYSVA